MKKLIVITLALLCCGHALYAQAIQAKADQPQSFKDVVRDLVY